MAKKSKSLKEIISEVDAMITSEKQAAVVEVKKVETDIGLLLTKTAETLRDVKTEISYEDLVAYVNKRK